MAVDKLSDSIARELVKGMIEDDVLSRAFWVSSNGEITRLVLSEAHLGDFITGLSQCIMFQDGGVAHLEVYERGGEKGVTPSTIQLWSGAVNATEGMMFENGGKLDITWIIQQEAPQQVAPLVAETPKAVEKEQMPDYEKMSVKALKALCQTLGIKGVSAMRKSEIINVIVSQALRDSSAV